MTVFSDTYPQQIEVDKVEAGRARLLVRWDINSTERLDPVRDAPPRTEYTYSERVVWWTLPKLFASLVEVQEYLDENALEIINWAQATEMDISGPPLNIPLSTVEMAQKSRTLAVSTLNAEYAPQFQQLQNAYMASLILGDDATMATNRDEYQALLGSYNSELGAIP